MKEYNLTTLIHHNCIYLEIHKGMYGLPQASRSANDCLTAFLAPHGYAPVPITPGLWKHADSDLVFALVADDFGIKYTNKANAEVDAYSQTTLLHQRRLDWGVLLWPYY
jgi:hypothetical protein